MQIHIIWQKPILNVINKDEDSPVKACIIFSRGVYLLQFSNIQKSCFVGSEVDLFLLSCMKLRGNSNN